MHRSRIATPDTASVHFTGKRSVPEVLYKVRLVVCFFALLVVVVVVVVVVVLPEEVVKWG